MKTNPFTSKANVLEALYKKVKCSRIEKPFIFTIEDWIKNEEEIILEIQKIFLNKKVIIRSSAIGEDSIDKSNAGNFLSLQNISTKKNILKNAIMKVKLSYAEKNSENKKNQILIQEQTKNVKTSGVIFTRTSDIGSPYYVINFEDSQRTDSVTKGINVDTIMIFRKINSKKIPKKWRGLINAIKEIERFFESDLLDIEFAITKNEIIIFQVRPLTSIKKENLKTSEKEIEKIILKNKKKFFNLNKNNLGKKLIYSDMTDWNPAEIIGNDPNPLDYSLYDFLIMKNSWSLGRTNLGYSDMKSPLMTKFGNKPYVNVGLSFSSLIPNSIDKKIREKLLKFYLKKLEENPELHDKVEFKIVHTCYDFTLKQSLQELENVKFSKEEIKHVEDKLLIFTNNVIKKFPLILNESKNEIEKMNVNRKIILEHTNENNINSLVKSVKLLLNDCIDLGTITFSSVARIAFIGTTLLSGLKNKVDLQNSVIEDFLSSIDTPLSSIRNDLELLRKNHITKEQFLDKYGHLRPGTYDITAKRYDKQKEFFEDIKFLKPIKKIQTKLPQKKINELIKKSKLEFNDISFIQFVSESIRQREYIKFEFTKNLSDAIELIAKIGENLGFTRSEISNIELNDIFKCEGKTKQENKIRLKQKISKSNKQRDINKKLINSQLIFNIEDFELINYYNISPNFISDKKLTSNIIHLRNSNVDNDLTDKIIVIENADPGFDWIFTKNPAGLVTKYGGVASHMAIRCAELRLPAVIGCGELIFNQLKNSKKITIDCKNEKIVILEYNQHDEYLEEKKVLRSLGYIK